MGCEKLMGKVYYKMTPFPTGNVSGWRCSYYCMIRIDGRTALR
jgi:hypothetical protein